MKTSPPDGLFSCRQPGSQYHTPHGRPHPEYWPYPDVPPVKWPDAPADSVWQSFMCSKAYLKALCESEAGRFIYRTVEDAWGIAFYGWRGPTDFVSGEFVQPPYGRYPFIEAKRKYPVQPERHDHYAPRVGGPGYYRYFRNPGRQPSVTVFDWGRPSPYLVDRNEISSSSAHYGFTRREIDRPPSGRQESRRRRTNRAGFAHQ